MSCAVFCIGTELTRGELTNSNSSWLSTRLTELGFEVTEHVVVDDDATRIKETFLRLMRTHAIVVTTGGLGPTTDDLTTVTIAEALGSRWCAIRIRARASASASRSSVVR